jgi:hypothetical protein
MSDSKLILLGVGSAALSVRRALSNCESSSIRYDSVYGSTRNVERLPELEDAEISPFLLRFDSQGLLSGAEELDGLLEGADVLVSFPPAAQVDQALSDRCVNCRSIVYISSTGVYGKLAGAVDESSPVDKSSASAVARLNAEDCWRERGAIVLRAAGLYEKTSGMYRRLRSGSYKIPGDGTNFVSRIHLEDLATIILAALARGTSGSTYVVADRKPATHLEVASWLCDKMMLPIPSMVPLEEVHETLRGNRKVDSRRVLKDLGVELKYPTFQDGYKGALEVFPGDTLNSSSDATASSNADSITIAPV